MMARGSLAGHMQTQNGRAAEGKQSWAATAPVKEPQTYRTDFLAKGGPRKFPFEGRPGCAATRMWYTFSTGMSGIMWSFCRRETSPTHGAPAET